MSYVLVRDDGAFCAPPGQKRSYTRDLTKARQFPTREAADRERCENESIVPYEEAGQ